MFHFAPLPTWAFALGVFTSLFSVMNPPSASIVFAGATAGMDARRLRRAAFRASLTATIAMLTFALLGRLLFSFFGFTALAMRFVGGMLVMYSALGMIYGQDPHVKDASREDGADPGRTQDDLAIIPLGIPMLAGPGTISTVMGIIAGLSLSEDVVVLLAIIVLGAVCHLFLAQSHWVVTRLGNTGTKVLTKLMGLILAAVAMQFLINGVKGVATEIRQAAQVEVKAAH
jgi:multiple antibiotic resistance protein